MSISVEEQNSAFTWASCAMEFQIARTAGTRAHTAEVRIAAWRGVRYFIWPLIVIRPPPWNLGARWRSDRLVNHSHVEMMHLPVALLSLGMMRIREVLGVLKSKNRKQFMTSRKWKRQLKKKCWSSQESRLCKNPTVDSVGNVTFKNCTKSNS